MATLEISINTDTLEPLVKRGGAIELNDEAEEAIFTLIAIRDRAIEAIEAVKKAIVEKGRDLTPDFKGVVGGNVKGYIKNLDKYEAKDKSKLPDWALKTISFKKLDQKEIEEYKREEGKLPDGVTEKTEVTSFVLQYDKERAKEVTLQLFDSKRLVKE